MNGYLLRIFLVMSIIFHLSDTLYLRIQIAILSILNKEPSTYCHPIMSLRIDVVDQDPSLFSRSRNFLRQGGLELLSVSFYTSHDMEWRPLFFSGNIPGLYGNSPNDHPPPGILYFRDNCDILYHMLQFLWIAVVLKCPIIICDSENGMNIRNLLIGSAGPDSYEAYNVFYPSLKGKHGNFFSRQDFLKLEEGKPKRWSHTKCNIEDFIDQVAKNERTTNEDVRLKLLVFIASEVH